MRFRPDPAQPPFGGSGDVAGTSTTTDDGGGGGGTAPPPFEAYLRGVKYTDPDAYYAAVQQYSLEEFNRQKAQLDRMYDAGLISYEQRQKALDDTRTSTMENISGYYSGISPEAYQSNQGARQQKAEEAYTQSTENLGREKRDWSADVMDNIAQLQSAYQNQADALANQLLDYTNNISPFPTQNPVDVMASFGSQDLTKGMYPQLSKKTKKKTTAKATTTPAPGKAALSAYLYPQTQRAFM
jgi:hypothetical protein